MRRKQMTPQRTSKVTQSKFLPNNSSVFLCYASVRDWQKIKQLPSDPFKLRGREVYLLTKSQNYSETIANLALVIGGASKKYKDAGYFEYINVFNLVHH